MDGCILDGNILKKVDAKLLKTLNTDNDMYNYM